ncbi:MAG: hypothetical protein NTY74_13445 [Ignavibacteriae bacterium]|nr:hypothetical protein [Ignavibacteriota bacterium]
MELLHLKIATCLYNQITKYDASYIDLIVKKYPQLNLNENIQRTALIDWLRNWGCRQFKKDNEYSSNEGNVSILNWYRECKLNIPNFDVNLLDFDINQNKESIITIFNSLAERKASTRITGVNVRIGPVGTAKILFALRPNLFAPWDTFIYTSEKYNLNGDGCSYVDYLLEVQKDLIILKNEFENINREWNSLFKYLNKAHNSYPKLIDEYNWITITKGFIPSEILKCCKE